MAKSTSPLQIAVPGRVANKNPMGSNVAVFQRGAQLYEDAAIGSDVELKFDDGTTVKGIVAASQASALIDLISAYGPQSVYTYSQSYSPRAFLVALGDGEVVDVTKLYTVVVVNVPPPLPQSMPSAA